MNALRGRLGVNSVVVGDLCAGAHAEFETAETPPGIAVVLTLNPRILEWPPGDSLEVADWRIYSELRDCRRRPARRETRRRPLHGDLSAGGNTRASDTRVVQFPRVLPAALPGHGSDDAGHDLLRTCDDEKGSYCYSATGSRGSTN